MATQTFRSKYAAIRQRALKFARRNSSGCVSQENADLSASFSHVAVSRNYAGPPASLSDSATSSEISARDYQPPSSRESSSKESGSGSQIIEQSSYLLGLQGAAPLRIAATLDSADTVANSNNIQFLSNINIDCWDNGDGTEGEDDVYCLDGPLQDAVDGALQAFQDMLQQHSLTDSVSIQAYLAQCSLQSLQHFFVTAIDAKNAATLRRSAILHDADYFLGKLTPLIKVYQSDVTALHAVEESIDLLRKEVNRDAQRYVDMYSLENRLPGDTNFTPSFTYIHQASQAKVEEHRQKRPMARYFSRQVIEEGCALTDQDVMAFWEK